MYLLFYTCAAEIQQLLWLSSVLSKLHAPLCQALVRQHMGHLAGPGNAAVAAGLSRALTASLPFSSRASAAPGQKRARRWFKLSSQHI